MRCVVHIENKMNLVIRRTSRTNGQPSHKFIKVYEPVTFHVKLSEKTVSQQTSQRKILQKNFFINTFAIIAFRQILPRLFQNVQLFNWHNKQWRWYTLKIRDYVWNVASPHRSQIWKRQAWLRCEAPQPNAYFPCSLSVNFTKRNLQINSQSSSTDRFTAIKTCYYDKQSGRRTTSPNSHWGWLKFAQEQQVFQTDGFMFLRFCIYSLFFPICCGFESLTLHWNTTQYFDLLSVFQLSDNKKEGSSIIWIITPTFIALICLFFEMIRAKFHIFIISHMLKKT